jgi:hypothetical protein
MKLMKVISFLLLSLLGTEWALPAFSEIIEIPTGTRILVSLPNSITSSSIKSADTIQAYVAEDVRVNKKIVLSKGSVTLLNVENSQKPRAWGRPGVIQINGGTVTHSQGVKIPLTLSRSSKGKSGRKGVIILSVLSIPLMIFSGVGFYLLPTALLSTGQGVTLSQGLVLAGSTASSISVEIP